jgi:hypothetical protein
MSTAKLNVWVTKVGEPCKIDMDHQWYVHVLHCDGEILNWCDKSYTNLRTKCGHLEVEIPPGCYMVCATWSPGPGGTKPVTFGNHISHLSIIRAHCGEEVCATLFPPTFHWCGIWWLVALEEHIAQKRIPPGAVGAAREAVRSAKALLEALPEPDSFTTNMQKIRETRPKRSQ